MNVDRDFFSERHCCDSNEVTNPFFHQTELRFSSSAPVPAGKNTLPQDYDPGNYDVMCGKGKDCFNSVGNRRFRVIVDLHLEKYSLATKKSAKSHIVSEVVHTIHSAGGRFIKKEEDRWVEISDSAAREKVGALFRDTLHFQYRSSGKAKTARRQQHRRSSIELARHRSAPILPPRATQAKKDPPQETNQEDTAVEVIENVSQLLSEHIHEGIVDDEYVQQDLMETDPHYHETSLGKRRKVRDNRDTRSTYQYARRSFGQSVLFNELQMIQV